MTAPPDSTPAGLGPAGRCDGIAGDAETTTGPPKGWAAAVALIEALTERGEALLAERDQARRIAVALESEVAALTDALTATTHEFEPKHNGPARCHLTTDDGEDFCWGRPDAPIHRTPARVRAELEGQ